MSELKSNNDLYTLMRLLQWLLKNSLFQNFNSVRYFSRDDNKRKNNIFQCDEVWNTNYDKMLVNSALLREKLWTTLAFKIVEELYCEI